MSRPFLSYLWDNGSRLTRDAEKTVTRLRQELDRIQRPEEVDPESSAPGR